MQREKLRLHFVGESHLMQSSKLTQSSPSTPLRLRAMLAKPSLSSHELAHSDRASSTSNTELVSSPHPFFDTDSASHTDSPLHTDFTPNSMSPDTVIIDLDQFDQPDLLSPLYGPHLSHISSPRIKSEFDIGHFTPKSTFLPTPTSSVNRIKVKLEPSSPALSFQPIQQLGSPFRMQRSDCPSLASAVPLSSPVTNQRVAKRALDGTFKPSTTSPIGVSAKSQILHVKHRSGSLLSRRSMAHH